MANINEQKITLLKAIIDATPEAVGSLIRGMKQNADARPDVKEHWYDEENKASCQAHTLAAIKAILTADECFERAHYLSDTSQPPAEEVMEANSIMRQHISALSELSHAQASLIGLFNYGKIDKKDIEVAAYGFSFTCGSYTFSLAPFNAKKGE